MKARGTFIQAWLAVEERPRYLAFITVITLLYLIVELAFNARLLDVVGGMPTADEVSSIEKAGRFISGTALAIAVWGLRVLPHSAKRGWTITRTCIWLFVSGAACILFAYFAEQCLINRIVDSSSARERYVAVNVKMLSQAFVTNNVEIDKVSLTREQFASPEGKSFLALFPFFAFTIDGVDQKISTKKAVLIRNMVSDKMGSLHVTYNRYVDSNVEIKKLYNNEYLKGTEQYLAVLRSIPDRQRQAWNNYELDLRQKRLTPGNVPRMYWGRVRDGVQSTGVNVPYSWNPGDRQTFCLAVADKITKQADGRYNEEMSKRLGGSGRVKPNLPFIEFALSPTVQEQWRKSLHFPAGVPLRPDISNPATFSKEVYEPILGVLSREQIKKYDAPVAEFGNGMRLAQFGKEGMRAIVVPPIALFFSIVGALVHIFKLGSFLIFLITSRPKLGKRVMAGAVLAIFVYVGTAQNVVVVQPLYPVLHRQAAEHFCTPVALMARWVIQAQPFAYPVNEWVRLKVLSGATFGYHSGVVNF